MSMHARPVGWLIIRRGGFLTSEVGLPVKPVTRSVDGIDSILGQFTICNVDLSVVTSFGLLVCLTGRKDERHPGRFKSNKSLE